MASLYSWFKVEMLTRSTRNKTLVVGTQLIKIMLRIISFMHSYFKVDMLTRLTRNKMLVVRTQLIKIMLRIQLVQS